MVKQNFKIFLKDKKIILETIFKEEKINRVKKGRINEMCNYKHNELINIKALKNQFRKSTKIFCISEENKLLYKVKTKHTDAKTNKFFLRR